MNVSIGKILREKIKSLFYILLKYLANTGASINKFDSFYFSCRDSKNAASLCHKNANCWFIKEDNGHECKCKDGYQIDGYKNGDPKNPNCIDNCIEKTTKTAFCKNQGTCLKVISTKFFTLCNKYFS